MQVKTLIEKQQIRYPPYVNASIEYQHSHKGVYSGSTQGIRWGSVMSFVVMAHEIDFTATSAAIDVSHQKCSNASNRLLLDHLGTCERQREH